MISTLKSALSDPIGFYILMVSIVESIRILIFRVNSIKAFNYFNRLNYIKFYKSILNRSTVIIQDKATVVVLKGEDTFFLEYLFLLRPNSVL